MSRRSVGEPGWFGVWPLPLVLVLAGVTVMALPTGRLPSPAWRPVVGLLVVIGAVLAAVSALWPVEYARVRIVSPHPFDLPGAAAADAFYQVARPVGYLLFQLVWAACVVLRLRRADGVEASQLRWFVYAVAATAAVMVTGLHGCRPGSARQPMRPPPACWTACARRSRTALVPGPSSSGPGLRKA